MKLEYISNDKINSLIKYIHKYRNEYHIYAVNVHGVGIEYRLWRININTRLKVNYLAIEDILNRNYKLCVNLFDEVPYLIELDEYQYKQLEKVIKQYWIESGEHWQDRGLY